ncbi:hypothetical protein V8B55DRAFT_1518127 [Mucor lusitanicus]|uniref:Nucleoside diphosphate kinase n=2 Tax=Mucor circinelloides f. lusitanicus TaxID=29924 RepID=A0A8H4BBL3_MUCCL|nr:hypothetical protein FB192DRAFT_1395755 [Mucor lusitanicus]
MITATKNPTQENVSNEFLQARNKLKKVSSAGTIEDITVEEEGKEASSAQDTTSENISHSNLQERTLAILTDTSDLDAIIQLITSNGFTIVTSKKFELTPEEAEEFYQDHAKQNYYEKAVRWLSSSKLCALVLEKENAIKDWRHLMGPTTYKKARKTSPNSIRALFGKDASQNATHGSDSDVSASKEIEYLFGATAATAATAAATTTTTTTTTAPTKEKHEEPTKVVSEVKQDLEGSRDVTASDTTPVSEKEETNNNNKDVAVSVKESDVNVETSQKPVALESKKDIAPAKEEPSTSNVPEGEVKNVPSDEEQARAQPNGDTSNTLVKDAGKDDATTTTTTKSNVEETAEIDEHKAEKEQESSTIAAAASTAVSVATTVVTGVTEVASAAVTAVSAAVAGSGTEQKTDTDANDHQEKAVTIEETPVIHDIIIPEPKPEASPEKMSQQIEEDNSTETNSVVPEIKNAATAAHQDKSNSTCDLKASTSSNTSCPEMDVHNKPVAETSTDQGDNSSRTNTSDDADAKKKDASAAGNAQQNATTNKRVVRKSAVHPSNSRIRPPSINKGHSNATKTSLPDTVKKPAEGSDHKVRPPQSRTTRASNSGGSNGSNGATRIARLSAPIKKAAPAPPADKVATTEQQPAKKAVTKVSKNLPRVATLAKPPVSSSKAAEQDVHTTTEKPKKRLSSTKSFISRLTAPTVASANKKAAATTATATETEAPTRRTSALKKRQSLTVKPTPTTEAQGPNKANNNNNTQQQEQQHPNSEMTSISTNESLSRPTTPSSATDEKGNEDKNHAFIDTSVETTV